MNGSRNAQHSSRLFLGIRYTTGMAVICCVFRRMRCFFLIFCFLRPSRTREGRRLLSLPICLPLCVVGAARLCATGTAARKPRQQLTWSLVRVVTICACGHAHEVTPVQRSRIVEPR